jgi:hypothetical protein
MLIKKMILKINLKIMSESNSLKQLKQKWFKTITKVTFFSTLARVEVESILHGY